MGQFICSRSVKHTPMPSLLSLLLSRVYTSSLAFLLYIDTRCSLATQFNDVANRKSKPSISYILQQKTKQIAHLAKKRAHL